MFIPIYLHQSYEFHSGDRFGLSIGMKYSTGVSWCIVLKLLLFLYYIHIQNQIIISRNTIYHFKIIIKMKKEKRRRTHKKGEEMG